MIRNIWRESYPEHGFPSFPCPRCKNGKLRRIDGSFKAIHDPVRENPLDRGGKFSVLLTCSMKWCGQTAAIAGDIVPDIDYDEHGEQEIVDRYYPRAMLSEIPVMSIDPKTPSEIALPIRASFSLLWADRRSAANKLRISIERMLDHFGVSRRNAKDTWWASLEQRIEAFKAKEIGHGDTFDALRVVGNRGSHDDDVSFNDMLDSYEILEDALVDLFGGRKTRLAKLRSGLMAPRPKRGT